MAFTPITQQGGQGGFTPLNKLQPNQAATALGHSNGIINQMLSGAGQLAGGIANTAEQFVQSAAEAPTDIIRGVQGKQPFSGQLPNLTGGTQQTIQAEAANTASDVFEGKTSPLSGMLKSVGETVGGGLNFIGLGIGKSAAEKAIPAVEEAVAPAVKDIAEKRGVNLATKRLSSTAETMTKAEREAAIKEGRMTAVGRGGKYIPSATESRAGEIMKGKTYANPVKTVSAIQKEIATRGQEAETYLQSNAAKISNAEDFKAFDSARASSQKYMTPSESKAYEEQIGVFQNILKDYSKEGGYNTSNYYQALKDYESQVTANLPKGKEALLKEGGAARIQAAKDVRSVVRDMIGQKNPEFKGKMFDLASLYDVQDNVISKAESLGTFAKRHPVLTKTATYGAEAVGAGAMYEAAKKAGVPLP